MSKVMVVVVMMVCSVVVEASNLEVCVCIYISFVHVGCQHTYQTKKQQNIKQAKPHVCVGMYVYVFFLPYDAFMMMLS